MSEETPPNDDSGQTSGDSWRDSLPEGFADAPFIKAADTPEAALSEIQNAAAYMGNSLRLPGEDASTEARQEFYNKVLEKAPDLMPKPTEDTMEQFYASLGRPESPDGYNYEAPEGKEIPPDFEAFAQTAHKHGLSQEQFKGILGEVLGGQWEAMEVAQSEQNAEMQGLTNEWGLAFDKNMTQVKNFLKLSDAPEGIVDLITQGAMSPTEIKWLHSIATQTKSPTELAQHHQEKEAVMTPVEAREQIQEMLNNDQHAYWNATDPRHQDAIKKMLELQKFANAGQRQAGIVYT